MTKKLSLLTLASALLLAFSATDGAAVSPQHGQQAQRAGTTFTVRIENVSQPGTLQPSDGSVQAVPLSPGVWVVHTTDAPLFSPGEPDRGLGLEPIAEDGQPGRLAQNLPLWNGVVRSGVFNTPVGADAPGPVGPGAAYEFTVTAEPGMRLSFATMFVPSNDLFYAPGSRGISLFDATGRPVDGVVRDGLVALWDVGTEVNQEPGVGADQVQRQSAPDTGPAERGVVQQVVDGFQGHAYPTASEVIRIRIDAN